MNKNFQKAAIGNMLRKKGYNPDLYDLDAHIDSTLSFGENSRIIQEDIRFMKPKRMDKSETSSVRKLDYLMQAKSIHDQRSPRAYYEDNSRQAKKTFEMSQLNKKNFGKWKKNPNKYDITGVDSKFMF